MKLSRILRDGPDGPLARVVGVRPDEDVVVDLRSAERLRLEADGASREAAGRLAAAVFPGSLTAALEGGPSFVERAMAAIEDPHDEAVLPIGDVRWLAAIDPPTMQDGSAFEQHLVNAHARGKREVPDLFYEVPVYYKMNPLTVIGHEGSVPWPGGAKFMDYELEIALVIGTRGQRSASRRGARPRPGGHGDERLQRPGRPGRGDDGRVRSRQRARTSPPRSGPGSPPWTNSTCRTSRCSPG